MFCLLYAAGVALSSYVEGISQDGKERTYDLISSILPVLIHISFLIAFRSIKYFFDDISLAFMRKKRNTVNQSEPFRRFVWALGNQLTKCSHSFSH